MPELINIQKVVIGPKHLLATLNFAPGGPVMTNANPQATERVKWLVPEIMRHACTGDSGEKFGISISRTEIAHLVEHVTLELMARSGSSEPIMSGRTRRVADHLYEVELVAPNDVLTTAALASAVFIVNWAFQAKDNKSAPNVEAIVEGIRHLLAHAQEIEDDLKKKKEAEEAAAAAEAEAAAKKAEEEAAAAELEKLENKPSETGALGGIHAAAPSAVSAPKPRDPKFMTGAFEILEPTEQADLDVSHEAAQGNKNRIKPDVTQEDTQGASKETAQGANQASAQIAPNEMEQGVMQEATQSTEQDAMQKTNQETPTIHLGTTVGFMNPSAPAHDEDY